MIKSRITYTNCIPDLVWHHLQMQQQLSLAPLYSSAWLAHSLNYIFHKVSVIVQASNIVDVLPICLFICFEQLKDTRGMNITFL